MADHEQPTAAPDAEEMTRFEVPVTAEQKTKIAHLAKQRGVSEEEAVRRLIDEAFPGTPFKARKGSFFEGIEHVIGSVQGPPDRLRDPNRMEGYGTW